MIRVYVGDITQECHRAATKFNKNAKLLAGKKNHLLTPGDVYYTSLGDIGDIKKFSDVMSQASELWYVPPLKNWSDSSNGQSYMQHWTEFYLRYYSFEKIVVSPVILAANMEFLDLVDCRKSTHAQLWISGCSISHGSSIDRAECYGSILSQKLQIPVSFLTKPGSSIEWQADQILRSDLRSGDILVWGLTNSTRIPYYQNNNVLHLNASYFESNPRFKSDFDISRLFEDDLYYRSVTKIYQVVNFCKKLGVKLYFAGMLVDPEFLPYLMSLPNYIQFHGRLGVNPENKFYDFGKDAIHPGPKTHAWYADILLRAITKDNI